MKSVELGKYMIAMPPSNSLSGKTKEWVIRSVPVTVQLGKVRWLGRWRCYAFFPFPDTVFNAGCMNQLAEFCAKVTKEHKA